MKIIRLITLLLCSSLLLSCVAAMVAGAAGLVVYDRRSVTMLEKDARIFYLIHTKTVTDPAFNTSRIAVVSFNQIVLLLGQTPSAELRMNAEKIARRTPNVRRVYDEITVDYPISFQEQANDSWITGQIRTRLLAQKGLESGSIRVVTEQGLVYLMGIATSEQADLAVEAARQVSGVKKVIKVFQYIN